MSGVAFVQGHGLVGMSPFVKTSRLLTAPGLTCLVHATHVVA